MGKTTPIFVSKEKPAAVKLLAAGLKAADSKKSQKWGREPCRVLFVPGRGGGSAYAPPFYDGTLAKYARALNSSLTIADGAKLRSLVSLLRAQDRDVPAGVLVTLRAPRRYDEWSASELPLLAVRGRASADLGGNWVYEVADARVLARLPSGMKLPGVGKARLPELQAAELEGLAAPPVAPPTSEEQDRLRQITLRPIPNDPELI